MKRSHVIVAVVLALMATPLVQAIAGFAARGPTTTPWLDRARADSICVLPQATVRYQHGEHLRRLRDQVVRAGQRALPAGEPLPGMASCRGCHIHRERFCDRCHERAAIHPDCWACHAY